MILDLLVAEPVDRRRGGTVNYKMERGRITELLLLAEGGSFNRNDTLSVKLRPASGTVVVVDNISLLDLVEMCDLKNGKTVFGRRNAADAGPVTEPLGGETSASPGQWFPLNAVTIPLGHISLGEGRAELEITLNVAKAFGNIPTFHLVGVEGDIVPDHVFQYEYSNDLEATHSMVREVYLTSPTGNSFFVWEKEMTANAQGVMVETDNGLRVRGLDIKCRLETGARSYESNIMHMGAITAIKGELDVAPSSFVRVFQDLEGIPTPSVRIKVSGKDRTKAQLLIIRETLVQILTSVSTISVIEKNAAKTEALEKMDPKLAQAYRHAGVTTDSGSLKDQVDFLKARTPAAVTA